MMVSSSPGVAGAGPNGVVFAQSSLPNLTLLQYNSSTPDVTLNAGTFSYQLGAPKSGSPVGGGLPHENRQPSLGLWYLICTSGIFPPRP
jgi:microcystin-dependent protein